MEELCIEGLANHGGPGLCVGVPRGRSEVLVRGARRPAIERRKASVWGADVLTSDGRRYRWRRFRESLVGPAGSENLCMRAISPCSRTGRAHSHPWRVGDASPYMGRGVACRRVLGRAGKAEAVIP
jgi:hypothetical protein